MPRHSSLVVILALALTAGGCAARGGVPRPFPGAAVPPGAGAGQPDEAPTADAEALAHEAGLTSGIVATALALRGVPYRYGGSEPSHGFDCSGFVQYVFAQAGTMLPREAHDQFREGRAVDRDELRPGDLVFFETVSPGASHVGMAIGGGQFVHAPNSRGVVRVEHLASSYWAKRFLGGRRVEVDTPALTH